MTANFCGACGATLLSGVRFCPSCGKPVAHAAPPTPPAPPAPPDSPGPHQQLPADDSTRVRPAYVPPPAPPSGRPVWVIVATAAVVVVVGAIAATAYLFLSRSSPEDQARSAVTNAYDSYYFGRCEQAAQYIDGPHDDVVKQCTGEKQDVARMAFGRSRVHGDKGTVAVTVTRKAGAAGDHVVHLSVDVVRTGAGWKAAWQ